MKYSIPFQILIVSAAFATAAPASSLILPMPATKQAPVLYASDFLSGAIEEYRQHGINQQPFASIGGLGASIGLFVDRSGNLYVAQSDAILEFAPGGKAPLKTYDDAGHDVGGVAVCPNGTLYAANSEANTISVYAGGATEPTGTITIPGVQIFHLACDGSNDLFMTVGGPTPVLEIPANGSGPIGLPISLGFPEGIEVDRAGDIVVADTSRSALAFYRPGKNAPFKSIAIAEGPLELTFSDNDRTVWATNSTQIFRYTVATGRLTDTLPLEAGGIAASPED